jgi:hypothetical protein
MANYRVSFFRNGRGSRGHAISCLQEVIEVRHAKNLDRAVQTAERAFEHSHHVPHWWQYADFFELEINGQKVDYHPSPLQG